MRPCRPLTLEAKPSYFSSTFCATMGPSMKKLLVAIVLLVKSFPLLLAGTNPGAQQLLVSAKQQANLFHDESSPFLLDVDFIAQINVPSHGHLTLKWQAKSQWWRRIVMGESPHLEVTAFSPKRFGTS